MLGHDAQSRRSRSFKLLGTGGLCLILASSFLTSTEAAAQRTGTRMGGVEARAKSGVQTPDTIRSLVSDYAICVIRNSRKNVEDYLASPPDSDESQRLFYKVENDDCLRGGELMFTDADFRGGAYSELYRLDFAKRRSPDLASRAQPDYLQGLDLQDPVVRAHVAFRQFADCSVRSAPAEAHALVLSRIASSEENAAFSALAPHLGPCVSEGEKISFSKGPLKGVISEVLYRASKAPVKPQEVTP